MVLVLVNRVLFGQFFVRQDPPLINKRRILFGVAVL